MPRRQYFGCQVRQRQHQDTTPFFVFYARSKDVKQWAGIRRTEEIEQGTQRLLSEYRLKAIRRFIHADPLNTIPNSILLAFTPNTATFRSINGPLQECLGNVDLHNECQHLLEWGLLEFDFDQNLEEHLRPALIVDGQHRLFGMSSYQEEDLPILIVSLVDAPLQEQAFQFIVINNKAVRVKTDNVKAIIADIDEEQLQARLLEAGVSYGEVSPILRDINDLPESPFRNLLDWPYNRTGTHLVPLTAIEQCLRYIRALFEFLGDDEDSLVGLFIAIWQATKSNYLELWTGDSKFMTKVSINALNEYLVDYIKAAWVMGLTDIADPDSVQRLVLDVLKRLPAEFWQVEWSIRIQDNANVREMIKRDLSTLIDNSKLEKHWTTGLRLPEVVE